MADQRARTGATPDTEWLLSEAKRMGVPVEMCVDYGEALQLYWQAKREQRDGRMWWIAVLSALASVLSAAVAWYAVLSHAR